MNVYKSLILVSIFIYEIGFDSSLQDYISYLIDGYNDALK